MGSNHAFILFIILWILRLCMMWLWRKYIYINTCQEHKQQSIQSFFLLKSRLFNLIWILKSWRANRTSCWQTLEVLNFLNVHFLHIFFLQRSSVSYCFPALKGFMTPEPKHYLMPLSKRRETMKTNNQMSNLLTRVTELTNSLEII